MPSLLVLKIVMLLIDQFANDKLINFAENYNFIVFSVIFILFYCCDCFLSFCNFLVPFNKSCIGVRMEFLISFIVHPLGEYEQPFQH